MEKPKLTVPKLTVIDGKAVTDAEIRAQNAAAVMVNSDVTRLQLMAARLQKAVGKNVKTRIALGAVAVLVGKIFTVIPLEKHLAAINEFVNLVAIAVRNEYTPEQREQWRQMALAQQKAQEIANAEAGQSSEGAGRLHPPA